jgi:molecular chaperone HtpG
MFIKEGCVSDPDNREQLAGLLRFQSSGAEGGELVSLMDYTGRMKEGQQLIYYLNGPAREVIEASPYLEAFRARDIEVLYLLDPVDDFVMAALQEFQGKKLVSADQADLELPPADENKESEVEAADGLQDALSPGEIGRLAAWMKEILGDMVGEVRESRRLVSSPAVIVNPDQVMTTSMQRVFQAANREFGGIGPKVMEINPKNRVIIKLARLHEAGKDDDFLRTCVEQVADNAFLAAGLPGSRNKTVDRIYMIMERALEG